MLFCGSIAQLAGFFQCAFVFFCLSFFLIFFRTAKAKQLSYKKRFLNEHGMTMKHKQEKQ